jgi:integrase
VAKTALSEFTIKNLQPPKQGQKRLWDTSLPGFGLRISQGGAKTWIVLDPRSKVRTQETIGRYPLISLQDARSEAKRRLAEATLGKHRPRSVAWDEALTAYLAEVEATRRTQTHRGYKRLLGRHFRFGATKLSDIAPADLHKKLHKLDATPSEKHHAFVAVRAFFNWAYRRHYVSENPIARMEVPAGRAPRARILTDDELKRIWQACGEDQFGRVVKALILTGQRVGEITSITEDMVGENAVTLPGWLTKNGKEHRFPASAQVKALLPAKLSNRWRGKLKIDKACGVCGWTLHDLRRTTASGMARIGVSIPVIEKLLNHISGSFAGIVGVYQRHDYFEEMKDALVRWEQHIETLTA